MKEKIGRYLLVGVCALLCAEANAEIKIGESSKVSDFYFVELSEKSSKIVPTGKMGYQERQFKAHEICRIEEGDSVSLIGKEKRNNKLFAILKYKSELDPHPDTCPTKGKFSIDWPTFESFNPRWEAKQKRKATEIKIPGVVVGTEYKIKKESWAKFLRSANKAFPKHTYLRAGAQCRMDPNAEIKTARLSAAGTVIEYIPAAEPRFSTSCLPGDLEISHDKMREIIASNDTSPKDRNLASARCPPTTKWCLPSGQYKTSADMGDATPEVDASSDGAETGEAAAVTAEIKSARASEVEPPTAATETEGVQLAVPPDGSEP